MFEEAVEAAPAEDEVIEHGDAEDSPCISESSGHEVQLALPSAVVCLASALAHYDLTTYEPPSVQVATRRGNRTKSPIFPPTRQFSLGGIRHELGVVAVEVEGRTIKIYDREKTICDCVRFRRSLGQDVVNEAIRNYLQGPERNVDRVMEYSHVLREEGPVRTHLRILG